MLLAVVGIAFGIIGGMGLGGGIVLIPVLTGILGFSQHEAQALCLFCFLPMSLCAVIMHFIKKNIDLKKVFKISVFGLGGAALGATLANVSQGDILKMIFALFLLVLGGIRIVSFLRKKSQK